MVYRMWNEDKPNKMQGWHYDKGHFYVECKAYKMYFSAVATGGAGGDWSPNNLTNTYYLHNYSVEQ